MTRLGITRQTLVALFARSGNVCAFPGCTHVLVSEANTFVAQICHIEAASSGGPRYRSTQTDEERRSAANLMLMCYRHHKETDNISTFPVAKLREMKQQHESQRAEKPFKINEEFLYKLADEMQIYWEEVSRVNRENHPHPEFRVSVDGLLPPIEQFARARNALSRLEEFHEVLAESDDKLPADVRDFIKRVGGDPSLLDAVPYYESPIELRNWEIHALALRNWSADLAMALDQCEVRFLEEYLGTHPTDVAVRNRLSELRKKLMEAAASAGYVD